MAASNKTSARSSAPSVPKKSKSSIGAPSQLKQTSRKGKKAWRKNVDIEPVEKGLEEIRSEERVYGTALHQQTNDELFQVDVKGDERARKAFPRFSVKELTSTKILAQRSAVPAVFSRPQTTKRKSVAKEDKERLLRIAKRPRKGPFGAIMDPTEFGSGSAVLDLSDAVKNSGNYDPWAVDETEPVEIKDGLEIVQPKHVKPPTTVIEHPRKRVELPAVLEPHQGTSYNPPVSAHQDLLLKAHVAEEKRVRNAEELAKTKEKMYASFEEGRTFELGLPAGMHLDSLEDAVEDEHAAAEPVSERKIPERKTKQQRRKAAKQLVERRALAEKAAKKRMFTTIGSLKALRKETDIVMREKEQQRLQRKQLLEEKLKKSIVGQRLGKHRVPDGEIDVQLGEDLSESLRGLKVEGNLFRDRFLSLQQRALVEPRVRVLPKKRKLRVISYEKHAWKDFDRE